MPPTDAFGWKWSSWKRKVAKHDTEGKVTSYRKKAGKFHKFESVLAMGKRQMRQVRFTVKPRCGKYLCLASRETKTLPRSTLFVAVYVAGSDGR